MEKGPIRWISEREARRARREAEWMATPREPSKPEGPILKLALLVFLLLMTAARIFIPAFHG